MTVILTYICSYSKLFQFVSNNVVDIAATAACSNSSCKFAALHIITIHCAAIHTALDADPQLPRTFCKCLITEFVSVVIELLLLNIYLQKKLESLFEGVIFRSVVC